MPNTSPTSLARYGASLLFLSVGTQFGTAAPAQTAPSADIVASGASPEATPAVNRNALERTLSAHGTAAVPTGKFRTDLASTQIPGPLAGPGQVGDSNGNWRASNFDSISRPPAARGRFDSIETAFDGDWSHGHGQEYRITGPDTLGRPATGYLFTPEASPNYLAFYNSSGWNQSMFGNEGRTAAVGYRVQGFQYGQGDLIDFSASCFVTGHRSGATNFLADPACGLFAGDAFAGSDGVYLNPVEIDLDDQGHATAGIGAVFNLHRTNSSRDLGVWWAGVRLQQSGPAPVDIAWSASGKFRFGLDFSNATFDQGEAAITLAPGQRIYGAAQSNDNQGRFPTSNGNDWITRDPRGGWDIVVDGSRGITVGASRVTASGSIEAPSFSSNVAVASAALGNPAVVGRGATVGCAPDHSCDQFSGTYLLSTGSGGEARGIALLLTFAGSRRAIPNCVASLQQDDPVPMPLPVGDTPTTHGITFATGTPLAPSSRYLMSYVCGGS